MYHVLKVVLLFLLSWSVNADEPPFSGTWKLISGEYIDYEGNLVNYESLHLQSLKVINDTHFSFVTMSGDKFWSAGSGTFTYTSNEYVESPVYTSYESPKGKQYKFTYKFAGNKWFSARWEDGTRVEHEVWQRVE